MIIINGQPYENGIEPDFGSVILVGLFHLRGSNRYLFKDADREKLELLDLAGDGSLAYCTDKQYTLIKHCGEWLEV